MSTITIPGMEFRGEPIPIDPDRVEAVIYWYGPEMRYVLYTGPKYRAARKEVANRIHVFYYSDFARETVKLFTKDTAFENVRLVEVVR